jgi:hypothetical protein
MHFTRYECAADLERTWDLLLKDAVDACGGTSGHLRLRAACTETQEVAASVAPSSWYVAPSAWSEPPSAWYEATTAWSQPPSAWYEAPSAWSEPPSAWYVAPLS